MDDVLEDDKYYIVTTKHEDGTWTFSGVTLEVRENEPLYHADGTLVDMPLLGEYVEGVSDGYNTFEMPITNPTVTPYGAGLERYKIVKDKLAQVNGTLADDEEAMEIINLVQYTNAYKNDTAWYTEFVSHSQGVDNRTELTAIKNTGKLSTRVGSVPDTSDNRWFYEVLPPTDSSYIGSWNTSEKFFDIKCRMAGLKPDAVVMVATVRALKSHGGVPKAELNNENLDAVKAGLPNLLQHVDNIKNVYGLPCVVAINAFPTDTEAELRLVYDECGKLGVNAVLSEVWAKGGEGGRALAEEVVRLCDQPSRLSFSYDTDMSIEDKLDAICRKIYHANGVNLTAGAKKQLEKLNELGFDKLPICMAKTQYSFTDNEKLLGAPKDFEITVRNLKVSAGAGFIVALTGEIMTMPGLPKVPAAEKIDVDENGKISGLF